MDEVPICLDVKDSPRTESKKLSIPKRMAKAAKIPSSRAWANLGVDAKEGLESFHVSMISFFGSRIN